MDGQRPDTRLDQDCMGEEDKTQRAKPTCTGRLQMSQDREDKEITNEEDDTSDHPRRNDQHTATTSCEHQQAHEEQSTEKMERVDAEWGP